MRPTNSSTSSPRTATIEDDKLHASTSGQSQIDTYAECSSDRYIDVDDESIKVRFFWSSVSIKLDGLRMFKVRRPIENFRLLVLEVSSNMTLDGIHRNP